MRKDNPVRSAPEKSAPMRSVPSNTASRKSAFHRLALRRSAPVKSARRRCASSKLTPHSTEPVKSQPPRSARIPFWPPDSSQILCAASISTRDRLVGSACSTTASPRRCICSTTAILKRSARSAAVVSSLELTSLAAPRVRPLTAYLDDLRFVGPSRDCIPENLVPGAVESGIPAGCPGNSRTYCAVKSPSTARDSSCTPSKDPLRRFGGCLVAGGSSLSTGSARRSISVDCRLGWSSQRATLRLSPVASRVCRAHAYRLFRVPDYSEKESSDCKSLLIFNVLRTTGCLIARNCRAALSVRTGPTASFRRL